MGEVRWVTPTYCVIHQILTNPVYAGVYAYGKTRQERYVDENGNLRKRLRRLPQSQWAVFIKDHHPGYIDWNTYKMNQSSFSLSATITMGVIPVLIPNTEVKTHGVVVGTA